MAGGGEGRQWAPRTDLPEVDRIMDGSKLKDLTFPNDKVDRISKMPEEILKVIISLLTMREAAATSVLSPRWRNLWTTSLSCLNFDVPNMRRHNYSKNIFEDKPQYYMTKKRSLFTKWVNHVITQIFCQESSRLDALRVSFILNTGSTPDIDTWIMSSVARGVTEIDLDFHYEKFYGDAHNPYKEYVFPAQQVASTISYLHLKFCKLQPPPDFNGFTSLVSLSLFCVYVTPTLVENIILSKCPLLEFLSMESCLYPDDSRFEFAGAYLRLKHLHIESTYGITSIKVQNINLLSFELCRDVPILSIKNAPHLARLVLTERPDPIGIISNTPRLETLFLVQHYEITCVVSRHLYVLNNLKRLVFVSNGITTYLRGVVHTLEACHLLESLELDMSIMKEREINRTRSETTKERSTALPELPLNNLKEVEIYGFETHPGKVALAKYLLDNAVVLQNMKIYTTSKMYCGNGGWEPCKDTGKQATPEEIYKMLPNVARSSAKVELFNSLNL